MAGIIINEDFENFMASRPPEKMTEAGLKEQIDHYARKQVEMIIFCGNGMRAMFNSHVFEPLWTDMQEMPDGKVFFRGREVANEPVPVRNNAVNCKRLYMNNENPFKTRIDYARSKGLRVCAGMRMNDIHWASDPDFPMHSNFWREHPEYRRAPYQRTWNGQALDYAVPEVRERAMALIHEYLERFDFDGIELDWMRTPPHFKPGFELKGLEILNDFMREVRMIADQAAKRSGHRVDVLVRVPSDPDTARRNGFDVPRWAAEKWVTHVTVTNFYLTTDYDPPLELWRVLLGSDVSLAAGLEINCRQHLNAEMGFRNTEAVVNGFAASFLYRGADKVYLFNHMDGDKSCMYDFSQFTNVLDHAGSRETVDPLVRRHVVTACDTIAPGCPYKGPVLPLTVGSLNAGWSAGAEIRLNTGGGVKGREAYIIMALDKDIPNVKVRLNTVYCPGSAGPDNWEKPVARGTFRTWSIPQGVLHDGDNVIEIEPSDETVVIDWCEILIQPAEKLELTNKTEGQ